MITSVSIGLGRNRRVVARGTLQRRWREVVFLGFRIQRHRQRGSDRQYAYSYKRSRTARMRCSDTGIAAPIG